MLSLIAAAIVRYLNQLDFNTKTGAKYLQADASPPSSKHFKNYMHLSSNKRQKGPVFRKGNRA
jgi:hypothetical protein